MLWFFLLRMSGECMALLLCYVMFVEELVSCYITDSWWVFNGYTTMLSPSATVTVIRYVRTIGIRRVIKWACNWTLLTVYLWYSNHHLCIAVVPISMEWVTVYHSAFGYILLLHHRILVVGIINPNWMKRRIVPSSRSKWQHEAIYIICLSHCVYKKRI